MLCRSLKLKTTFRKHIVIGQETFSYFVDYLHAY
uniref:Uncharacterized protein n=1 Tax=Siphoviridae sp. ctiOl67 TaxID=2825622 RepID=A0A8S5QIV7_9CAUD|nr:MAG TPA: hypothetical protein [Siphoviridae sp. ctiOl67]